MTDFLFAPDEIEPERPARPLRLVTTGLAPTATVPPRGRAGLAAPPCYLACSLCSATVLCGQTGAGSSVALDVDRPTYTVLWDSGAEAPTLAASRSYPEHRCRRALDAEA